MEIVSSEHNLIFGFADDGLNLPPSCSDGEDTRGTYRSPLFFIDAAGGDFHLLPKAPGMKTALNV